MRRLVEMCDSFIHAIDGNRILNEVVGADAEKIDFARKRVRGNGGARNFDHRADLHFFSNIDFGGADLIAAFVQNFLGVPQLLQAGNHWKHDFDVSNSASAKNGAQLHFEDVDVFQAKPNGAPAEKRI